MVLTSPLVQISFIIPDFGTTTLAVRVQFGNTDGSLQGRWACIAYGDYDRDDVGKE